MRRGREQKECRYISPPYTYLTSKWHWVLEKNMQILNSLLLHLLNNCVKICIFFHDLEFGSFKLCAYYQLCSNPNPNQTCQMCNRRVGGRVLRERERWGLFWSLPSSCSYIYIYILFASSPPPRALFAGVHTSSFQSNGTPPPPLYLLPQLLPRADRLLAPELSSYLYSYTRAGAPLPAYDCSSSGLNSTAHGPSRLEPVVCVRARGYFPPSFDCSVHFPSW
jgi:hypothetical protein